ncbi:hypothetical protein AG1IA_00333 [Rhizoctonia solani AG-1 IA]|uniref:Uncharacterized protein n=1 Tax=Thanatephorus cucumeris (strain AG1-IA) TaxID=983506 RepID=L8XAA8_THACA|nr:hypothetical protein AG1IA_00333 [Rhizoctonia solani AG-1 IA]
MDNALPTSSGERSRILITMGSIDSHSCNLGVASPKPGHHAAPAPQRTSLIKSFMSFIPFSAFQKKRAGHARQRSEGIIAPRTPNRSPMLSPSLGGLPQGSWSLSGEDLFADNNPPPKLTPPPPRRVTTDGLGLGVNGGHGIPRVNSATNLRTGNASPRLGVNLIDSPRGSMDLLDDTPRYGLNGGPLTGTGARSRIASRRALIPEGNEIDSPGGP